MEQRVIIQTTTATILKMDAPSADLTQIELKSKPG